MREAARAGIPTALLNPDALPGRANRFLARSVDLIFAQWAETAEHLPRSAEVVVAGCPVRPEFNSAVRAKGIERFGLDPDRKTLLVTGASQGARTINEAVLANVELLDSHTDWQVLHLTGERDYEEVRDVYGRRSLRAAVLVFTEHMAEALAAADLVIARAGASFLAEITAMGRAAILMPYPFHRDKHQFANARCLVRASAARIVHDHADAAINGPALREVLSQLLSDDAAREAMAAAARRMGRGNAAGEIADRILALSAARGADEERESLKAMYQRTRYTA
jgi:UDP-N-acetylglucosamine--N-acetylmuramyl-(pentapeptide) pyrophosphoryl-undecaprenol N-acetylglucosamine transferase